MVSKGLPDIESGNFTADELAVEYLKLEDQQREAEKRHWRVSTRMASLAAQGQQEQYNTRAKEMDSIEGELKEIGSAMQSLKNELFNLFTQGAIRINPKTAVADCLDQARKK